MSESAVQEIHTLIDESLLLGEEQKSKLCSLLPRLNQQGLASLHLLLLREYDVLADGLKKVAAREILEKGNMAFATEFQATLHSSLVSIRRIRESQERQSDEKSVQMKLDAYSD